MTDRRFLSSWLGASTLLAFCLLTSSVWAGDKALAESLFREGRRLMEAKQFEQACPKFLESNEQDPSPGTLLNLAECYEKLGRTESAWVTYSRDAELARARAQTAREKLATERAAAIEPELARLEIDVPDAARIEGLRILRGDTEVERASWGVAVPVDPGSIVIEATAPGRRSWQTTISVIPKSAQLLTSPLLEVDGAAPPIATTESSESAQAPVVTSEPAPAPADADPGSGQRTLGFIVGGVGLVGLAVGGGFALSARSKNEDSKSFCRQDDPNRCSAEGVTLREDAQTAGTIATVAFGLGLAAVAGGVVLIVTAPSSGQGAALSLGGSF